MLYQNPDSESMIIVIILIIAVFILVILLIATFALLQSEAKTKNKIESKNEVKTSLPVAVLDTFPENKPIKDDVPKNELKSSSLAGIFARLFPEDEEKNTFKINQRAINLLGVLIAVALMIGLILILMIVNPIGKVYGDSALARWFWSILVIFIGIAGGGAIGIRIAHLSWRQTVLSALLIGAGAMLVLRFEISPFYAGPWDFSEGNFQFYTFLIGTLAVSAPVFLLPLCDPLLRQSGLA
nr:hypothetical protein [Chloroflexota bacterium]